MLLGARLVTLLRRVAKCWLLKNELVRMAGCNIVARTLPNDYNIIMNTHKCCMKNVTIFIFETTLTMHVATCRNTSKQGGQMRAKRMTPSSETQGLLAGERYRIVPASSPCVSEYGITQECCDMFNLVSRAFPFEIGNEVAICCVERLRSFGPAEL